MAAERAPEPTMDEILASIKRIIADEDRGAREAEARRQEDFSPDPFPSDGGSPYAAGVSADTAHEQGDAQLIADIERALQNAGGPVDPGEDDILDLTRIMTDETMPAAAQEVEPAPVSDNDAFDLGSSLREDAAAPDTAAEPGMMTADAEFEVDDVFSLDTPAGEAPADPADDLSAEAITEAFSVLDQPAEIELENAPAEATGDDPWDLKSAVEADEEVLEFGRKEPVFADVFPAATETVADVFAADAMETPEPAADPENEVGRAGWIAEATDHPSDFDLDESTGQSEASASEVRQPDPESEMAIGDEAEQLETGTPPDAEIAGEQPQYDLEELYREHKTHSGVFRFLHSEGMNYSQISKLTGKRYQHVRNVLIASVAASTDESGASAFSSEVRGQKSLEDSVKEMLRPMLRDWLDENMPRILESALRDELQAGCLPKE